MKSENSGIVRALADDHLSRSQRRQGLVHVCQKDNTDTLDAILDCMHQGVSRHDYDAALRDLAAAPGRPATYVGTIGAGTPHPRGLCVLADGFEVLPLITSAALAREIFPGDGVLLDKDLRVILARDGCRPYAGEAVTYERLVGSDCAEITTSRDERHVVVLSAALRKSIKAEEVKPGDRLVANLQARIAFSPLGRADEFSHFKYLDRSAPTIDVDRGKAPRHPVVDEVVSHIRQEMTSDVRVRFGLPKSSTWMLAGDPGTGKSFSINTIIAESYRLMSAHTGTQIDRLPPRVMRLNASQILSKWLGDSEKNFARFFDESIELARRPFTAPDGKVHNLVCFLVLEECDGLGRQRGTDHDGVMDRILTTLLDRLDPSRPEYQELCIIGLFTSNRLDLVDPALRRRAGFRIHHFRRLTQRRPFEAVLSAQLARIPLADMSHAELVQSIAAWLFAAADDEVLAEISYVGDAQPARKYRRDFITHALVNRSVLQAASHAASREEASIGPSGVTIQELRDSFDAQICSLVEQLNEKTVASHVDIPDGAHVATVRRILRPVARHQLLRSAV